jgi:hypothetical protein
MYLQPLSYDTVLNLTYFYPEYRGSRFFSKRSNHVQGCVLL